VTAVTAAVAPSALSAVWLQLWVAAVNLVPGAEHWVLVGMSVLKGYVGGT